MSLKQKPRCFRRWTAGTRVRIDAPTAGFHGRVGTVEYDADPNDFLCVVIDDGRRGVYLTNNAARLRDQTPARPVENCEGARR